MFTIHPPSPSVERLQLQDSTEKEVNKTFEPFHKPHRQISIVLRPHCPFMLASPREHGQKPSEWSEQRKEKG